MVPTPNDPVAMLVFFLLVFTVVGAVFLFFHLLMGSLIRPNKPDAEKLTIYECGEPTVGSAWVQFDLRFYVVALLFVIFDVEVAFFFPWATVFGKLNQLSDADLAPERRTAITKELQPAGFSDAKRAALGMASAGVGSKEYKTRDITPEAAATWAQIVFWDILVFFGVLMVGFAYVWRRGDIDWVRAYAHHQEPPAAVERPLEQPPPAPKQEPVASH